MALPVILDCDPGHDDAIALILALASPELKVLAVTTSAGNQTPDKTLNNALRILTLLGRDDISVAAGAPKPLARELIIADSVHGESGLDGPKLPDPAFAPVAMTALELMARCLRESPEPVTLVPTGPLTNIALLLAAYPELKSKIARIVLMGGAAGAGNWTPAAEFNIYVDPEAADMVFKSGLPITMCGLDVTHQAQVMDEDIERVRAITNPVAQCVAGLLDFFMIYHRDPKWGFAGAPLHDPCTIAWLLAPALFHGVECRVDIETGGIHTSGMTVVDLYGLTGKPANALVLLGLERAGFIDLLVTRLRAFD
ncbi:pyrimidine-specific ribonucleoside hydrolase RihA [Aeromonas dhakensis]|uniref:pyrimidine-specific ribonucleoside hydrolase RihA n=1 Tax=Aeromonas dhakensis TaxID=196024 RepID=UPI00300E5DC2